MRISAGPLATNLSLMSASFVHSLATAVTFFLIFALPSRNRQRTVDPAGHFLELITAIRAMLATPSALSLALPPAASTIWRRISRRTWRSGSRSSGMMRSKQILTCRSSGFSDVFADFDTSTVFLAINPPIALRNRAWRNVTERGLAATLCDGDDAAWAVCTCLGFAAAPSKIYTRTAGLRTGILGRAGAAVLAPSSPRCDGQQRGLNRH